MATKNKPQAFFIFGAADGNKGAQAMLFTTVRELRLRFPETEIYCCEPCRDYAAYNFHVVRDKHLFLRLLRPGKKSFLFRTMLRLKSWLKPHGTGANAIAFANAFRKGNGAIVDIGGFQFSSLWASNYQRQILCNVEYATRYGLDFFFMPQSFGPFDYSEDDAAVLLPAFKRLMAYPAVIYARENDGYKALKAISPKAKVAHSHDLVLEGSPVQAADIYREPGRYAAVPALPPGRKVGILPNMRTFDHGNRDFILGTYEEMVRELLSCGITVYLFRHSFEDLEACRWIKERFADREDVVLLEHDFNCIQYEEFCTQFDYLLASRFHSIVHAFRRGIPCIALGWAVKYQNLMTLAGQERFVFNITLSEHRPEILAALRDMEKSFREQSETITRHISKIKNHSCFDFISSFYGQPTPRPHLSPTELANTVPDCTGCAACMNTCPTGAISLPMDNKGFYKPYIDSAACIHCNKCLNTCPVHNDGNLMDLQAPEPEKIKAEFFYGWSRDEQVRKASSSGGLFTELARGVISRGGCVFGVALGKDLRPFVTKAETMEELAAMRGSKYLQAAVDYAYREVERELRAGRAVLYTGTPCQIGGLKAYLKKDYPNLITADIICHGVPSFRLMEMYRTWMERESGKTLSSVLWRDKTMGWYQHKYGMRLTWNDSTSTYSGKPHDLFLRGFLCDLFLNDGCHHCRYTGMERKLPDITLADAWEIWLYHPELECKDGISLVIAHTQRGKAALLATATELHPANGDLALKYNPAILRPWPAPARKAEAWRSLGTMPLPQLLDTYTSPRATWKSRVKEQARRGKRIIKRVLGRV